MSVNRSLRGKCYEAVTIPYGDDGALRTVARYTCTGCGGVLDIRVDNTERLLSTDSHRKTLSQRRWWMNGHATEAMCLTCFSGGRKETPTMAASPKPDPSAHEGDRHLALVQPPKDPTAAQRRAIRQELEACFVEEDGEFIDGESDEAIGRRLNVPWAWVETAREAAYGRVRVTPEMRRIEAEAAAVRVGLDRLAAQVDESRRTMTDEINALRSRLAAALAKKG